MLTPVPARETCNRPQLLPEAPVVPGGLRVAPLAVRHTSAQVAATPTGKRKCGPVGESSEGRAGSSVGSC